MGSEEKNASILLHKEKGVSNGTANPFFFLAPRQDSNLRHGG